MMMLNFSNNVCTHRFPPQIPVPIKINKHPTTTHTQHKRNKVTVKRTKRVVIHFIIIKERSQSPLTLCGQQAFLLEYCILYDS
jgi:hypothetical protein